MQQGTIGRYETTPRQSILYLRDLERGQELRFGVLLRARFPVRAKAPRSVLYEYYNPANRRTAPPVPLAVKA